METPALDVRLVRPIHAGLTIDVVLCLGIEIGVLFGPSGSGKTSILRLITGLLCRARAGCGWAMPRSLTPLPASTSLSVAAESA